MQKLFLILILNISPGLKDNKPPLSNIASRCGIVTTALEETLINPVDSGYYPVNTTELTTDESPCSAQSITNGQLITGFFNTNGYEPGFYKLAKANVPGVATEFAIVFGINAATGIPVSLPMISTLSENSVSINASPANILVTAIAHTHHDNVFPAPSAGDLYAFGNYAQSHPEFLYYILAANGAKYVLAVTNPDSLAAFLKKYPQKINIAPDSKGNPGRGAGYNPGSELYLAMQKAANSILIKSADPNDPTLKELDAAHEAVQVYILDHFNTGMAMFKQDANGNFHELHTNIDSVKENSKVFACK